MKRNKYQLFPVVGIWLTIGVLILFAIALTIKQKKREQTRIEIDSVQVQENYEDVWGKNLQEEDL